ncbi:MAG TPA: MFS transporter [Verrucomicrobiota bacterium]|nr:MFS transporter [Verrucomicrobiota bacterium]
MLKTIRRAEYAEWVVLFFVQGAALGMWLVPLSAVLQQHGLQSIRPYAFATNAVAAFVSPLIFGAMADRHASPVKVLRGLGLATAATMTLASTAIGLGWSPWVVLATIQLHALCSSPTWSIASAIVFARLADAQMEFGSIRGMATLGWMSGCWLVSALGADASPMAGYSGAVVWLLVVVFTFFLPELKAPPSMEKWTLKQRLGLDALALLRNPDHRVVFITVALFSIPLAAFYPFTPPHLLELGFRRTSAWVSVGQVTEIFAMFSLGALLTNWRLKWIFGCGLGLGVLRFALSAVDGKGWLLADILLHGCSYTWVYVTAQIYIDQRVDPGWRARAQALISLMAGGFGNLAGYLGTGWWFHACSTSAGVQWNAFWGGLSLLTLGVMIYFLVAYRGLGASPARRRQSAS